jgi:predicted ATP-dependent serine protease
MVHIDGTAGAGKTDVVLRAIRQRFYKEKALVIAPSEKQSNKLAKILGEPDYYTIDESRNDNIFAKLLPQWDKIYSDFKTVE